MALELMANFDDVTRFFDSDFGEDRTVSPNRHATAWWGVVGALAREILDLPLPARHLLKARIIAERFKHWIEPKQRRSQRRIRG